MLRHRIDVQEMSVVDRSKERRLPVTRMRAPVVVNYRRDGRIDEVVSALRSGGHVSLHAAVGAGKSTRVPSVIAKELGCLVVHTIPFHIAAAHLGSYLAQKGSGGVAYVDDLDADLPSHGVVIMSNAHLVARLMNGGMDSVQKAVLYLDESHESDCWTDVVRSVGGTFSCFQTVVTATATANPESRLTPHLPGRRDSYTYTQCDPTTWSAQDVGQPWSADKITGNTMLCIDHCSVRERLRQEYRDHGFEVYLLDARSKYTAFAEAVAALTDRSRGVVILIVDYAYRSSLTIPGLTKLIDSCEVAYNTVEDDRPTIKYRHAFAGEIHQFLGRGGRIDGDCVELWQSTRKPQAMLCDLDPVEAEASNLLHRMFGFRPPLKCTEYAYFTGKVPINIPAALLSDDPLSLCPETSREEWVCGHPVVTNKSKVPDDYGYTFGKRVQSHFRLRKPEVERGRVPDPPPPVSRKHRSESLDAESLDMFARSRDSSRGSAVYTIRSGEEDFLSYGAGVPVTYPKPRRLSNRRREELAREAKESAERESVDSIPPVDEKKNVRDSKVLLDMNLHADIRSVETGVHGDVGGAFTSEQLTGQYIYYPGIEHAKLDRSRYFTTDVESVFRLLERDKHGAVATLPSEEKLCAMSLLVTARNSATAHSYAVRRLMLELKNRTEPLLKECLNTHEVSAQLRDFVDRDAASRAFVCKCDQEMSRFSDKNFVLLSDSTTLEETMMTDMMDRLRRAVVERDKPAIDTYLEQLGNNATGISSRMLGPPVVHPVRVSSRFIGNG